MRKLIWTITALGLLATAPAANAANASKEESIGVGTGGVIGAVAGGPIGFIIGAAIGAKIGDTLHSKESEIDTLRSLHLYFLSQVPKHPNLDAMNSIKSPSESFVIMDKVLYLRAPEGIARSKLAARAERLVGVDATARNWRTVSKILELTN